MAIRDWFGRAWGSEVKIEDVSPDKLKLREALMNTAELLRPMQPEIAERLDKAADLNARDRQVLEAVVAVTAWLVRREVDL